MLREGHWPVHITGILDSLRNVKLTLEEGFQSSDDNYMGNMKLNVTMPGGRSFKAMHPLDASLDSRFPASFIAILYLWYE